MDITALAPTPPAPGSTSPGDLYIDLQSRTLWLGVDPAVDPNEAVLISDIVGTEELIEQALLDANAYTDAQILTRAPLSHTHPSSQITDFTAAVQGVVNAMPSANFVTGMILMWSGSLAEIGVGDLAGWCLCDGSNGSPDLRDRFVIGAGNLSVGNKNTPANFKTDVQGAHTHTIDGTTLTIAQIPSHFHSGSGTTGSENTTHTHGYYQSLTYTVEGGSGAVGHAGYQFVQSGGQSANHQHAYSFNTDSKGGSGAHTHGCQSTGSHDHNITTAQIKAATPYFALAFIYKMA